MFRYTFLLLCTSRIINWEHTQGTQLTQHTNTNPRNSTPQRPRTFSGSACKSSFISLRGQILLIGRFLPSIPIVDVSIQRSSFQGKKFKESSYLHCLILHFPSQCTMYPISPNEERVLGPFSIPYLLGRRPRGREISARPLPEKAPLLSLFVLSSHLVFPLPGLLFARLHPACKLSAILIWRSELR